MRKMILIITVLFSGLIAGLLFCYSCSVNLGLHNLTDVEYVKAMLSINKEIQNFYFLSIFIGLLFLFPLATWTSYTANNKVIFYLLLCSTIIYFVGVFGVTIFGNLPLNNKLAEINLSNTSQEMLSMLRNQFETNWAKFHLIRTSASIISFLLTIIATQNPCQRL